MTRYEYKTIKVKRGDPTVLADTLTSEGSSGWKYVLGEADGGDLTALNVLLERTTA